MRRDSALMLDMLLAARKIQRFVAGMTVEEFLKNEVVQSAVIREFLVIGEAARLVTDDTKNTCGEISWKAMVGMRNRLVHEYFAISNEIVWTTVQTNIPPLIAQLEQYVSPDPGTAK